MGEEVESNNNTGTDYHPESPVQGSLNTGIDKEAEDMILASTCRREIEAEHETTVPSAVGDSKEDSNIGVEIDSQEGETNGERNNIEKDREDAKMEEPNAFSIDETEEDTSKVDEKKEDAVEKNETSKKSDTGLPDEHVPEKQEDEPVLRKEDQGK